jgi:DNA excision repair protein ERCC-2
MRAGFLIIPSDLVPLTSLTEVHLKRVLKIAVRELVEYVCRCGDLEITFAGSRRSVEAIRAHQNIQRSRPENYLAEVPVDYQHETDDLIISIGGRIDGVYTGEGSASDRVVIDEIKTTDKTRAQIEQSANLMHWGQAKAYAFMYAARHGLETIDVQLTYFQFDSGDTWQLKQTFIFTELTEFFQELIDNYLSWAQTLTEWCRLRDVTIRKLEFPFATYRPGQRKMAVDVYRAISTGEQLLVQAATGIGKTMAVVFASVKAMAEAITTKIFYLTARTTGRTVAEQALAELRVHGLRLKSLTLTAKDKICFNPDKNCTGQECEFARGYYDRLNPALGPIFEKDALTREYLEAVAIKYRLCPFELSLELSLYADCIIGDYNYAFDPRVYLRRFFYETGSDYTFLIDEAHNLVDRSREMFSAEIRKQSFLDVRRSVKDDLSDVYKSLGKINTWMLKARKGGDASQDRWADRQQPEGVYPLLRRFVKQAENWLTRNEKTSFRENLLDLYFTVSGFVRVAEQYDENYVTCYERLKKDLRVKLFCIDPSGQLADALKRCKAAIFFSATMTPVDYFKNIFGCRQSATHLILPSPFATERLGLFMADRISTLYKQRDMTAPEVTRIITTLVKQKKGNYLLYFPSYAYMLMIHAAFEARNPETDIVLQAQEMSESARSAFLARFSKDNPQTLVGFAVMGGIFGEGIDLVGERLCGAVIVGVGLPGISLEKELIREYFARRLNAGFEFAYMYPGINRVLQAAGRVIRSDKDRGVVLLIDQRFGTRRYQSLLPREWKPVRVQSPKQLGDHLVRFW